MVVATTLAASLHVWLSFFIDPYLKSLPYVQACMCNEGVSCMNSNCIYTIIYVQLCKVVVIVIINHDQQWHILNFIWFAWAEETDWYGNLPRGKPPHRTTPAQRRDILQAGETNPHMNAVTIRNSLHPDVCERTVRRVLHEAEVHHRPPAKKEYLNVQHREGRLQFAQQCVDKAEDYWKRMIWMDERTFLSPCHGRLHCWRRNNTWWI